MEIHGLGGTPKGADRVVGLPTTYNVVVRKTAPAPSFVITRELALSDDGVRRHAGRVRLGGLYRD